ncbi:MAG: hypothetical protein JRN26_02855 [Nitrososphaerota archaeon]|jgi:hypothetical protein|nr:hypothetical protein [Nitrososphaerota archaeon]MDG6928294.1 hypothetical protein [Nitrososphaerota archaeon]MDG6931555.1 hypothetical protein [Nitrososphaerota archaeon]MDG6935814.1 hypothetical protein [Nitrososphaerota archaeon]MDG6943473.1 hypothetical protein [Nitrososphaerota archaeon]
MFYGIKEEVRAFLQVIYGSVKAKNGSLILISEGLNDVSRQVRFVCDAIVEIKFVNMLGQDVRTARVLKDRDYEIEHPLHYMTTTNMSSMTFLSFFNPYFHHRPEKAGIHLFGDCPIFLFTPKKNFPYSRDGDFPTHVPRA